MDTALLLALLVGLVLGVGLGLLIARSFLLAGHRDHLVAARTENELLRERIEALQAADTAALDANTALAPLRETLVRVERQVGLLERDRLEQFGEIGERLAEVTSSTSALRASTASLVGSLNASTVRGTWGETQLRRVLEHAGMLARCDFDEQVSAVTAHDARIRPDVLVRLPEGKVLVIDAKAPMSAFMAAHRDGLDDKERQAALAAHGKVMRGHVDALAAKSYWTAFATTPEMVVCFVPSDSILAAALAADPSLFDHAQAQRVVLASPSTLLALLRTVAFTWQQHSLSDNARELLALGSELHARLGSLGSHVARLGSSLRRSVEAYNATVGAMESRVLVTARKMAELDLAEPLPPLQPLESTPRPLTAVELLEAVEDGAQRRDREYEQRDAAPEVRSEEQSA
ncbi:DNA recombination protein RmuC [Gephyromycinifex aptenodytis]|uniref:DNA recombination protein RmuC n=1 Tax=Gephyromycinifex aptenodytis TaxID=2716227 RepID=UPI0014451FEC|nr:DNA recombination protein RmuC [Gephyromycinifex aptenodytis]